MKMPRQINGLHSSYEDLVRSLSDDNLFDLLLETTDDLDGMNSAYEDAIETNASGEEISRILGERDMLEERLYAIGNERSRRGRATPSTGSVTYTYASEEDTDEDTDWTVAGTSPHIIPSQFSQMFERYQEAVMGITGRDVLEEQEDKTTPLKGIASQYTEDLNL